MDNKFSDLECSYVFCDEKKLMRLLRIKIPGFS
jgi:hypothetical protein